MKKKYPYKLQTPFSVASQEVMRSPAWVATSPEARVLYLELRLQYSPTKQESVFLSSRHAAKLLGFGRNKAARCARELEHYGFVVQTKQASIFDGKGMAAHVRLTPEPYKDKPASKDFLKWDGTPFGTDGVTKKTSFRHTRRADFGTHAVPKKTVFGTHAVPKARIPKQSFGTDGVPYLDSISPRESNT